MHQHFFGLIRHAAGCEDHPTASMFVHLYRLLSVYSLIRLPRRRNGRLDVDLSPQFPIPASKPGSKRSVAVAFAADCLENITACLEDESVDPSDIPDLSLDVKCFGVDESGSTLHSTGLGLHMECTSETFTNNPGSLTVNRYTVRQNIVFYVAGYVIRHCRKLFSCDICLKALTGSPAQLETAMLVTLKTRGALIWPSQEMFQSLLAVEDEVSESLSQNCDPAIFQLLTEKCVSHFTRLKSCLCLTHGSAICGEICVFYIITRLHWHVRQINQKYASKQEAKQNRKKAKLT